MREREEDRQPKHDDHHQNHDDVRHRHLKEMPVHDMPRAVQVKNRAQR
jgi:hypothetical protein